MLSKGTNPHASAQSWGWLVALLVFWLCALRNPDLPGLYMDAINPDYLAASWLNPQLQNPVWRLPGPALPLLGNLYHGTQNLWLGLLTYGFLGTGIVQARITHALIGAAIVGLAWLVLRRATGRPLLATVVGAALATDMAFLGSFRTQGYIIMVGMAWMLLSLWLALGVSAGRRTLTLLASGAAMGLAVYGYFVMLFFLPPVILLAVVDKEKSEVVRGAFTWACGFAFGMLPYVVGYGWAMYELGGWSPFFQWLGEALGNVKPMEGNAGWMAGVLAALTHTQNALAGIGNELMMTGEAQSGAYVRWRSLLLAVAMIACALAAVAWRGQRRRAFVVACIGVLPLSYVLLAGFFGPRLWVHHFTVLVPIAYVVLGMAIAQAFELRAKPRIVAPWVGGASIAVLLALNLVQQQRVHDRLVATGGAGMSSDALTVLARTALSEAGATVWIFPEWGFFMPFAFETGNRVAYEIELSSATVRRHAGVHDGVRVAFWDRARKAQYEQFLIRNGVENPTLRVIARRDGQPAIYVLAGRLAPEATR